MQSAILERVCPYCASTELRFLEHGPGGTLFQCEACARAAVQRWEPEAEAVPNTRALRELVFPSWLAGDGRPSDAKPSESTEETAVLFYTSPLPGSP